MRWKVLTPFTRSRLPISWIPAYVQDGRQSFEFVLRHYQHDHSRRVSGLREWLDFAWHALRGWLKPWRGEGPVGFITAFPQLPVMVGVCKRLSGSRAPVLAWTFNVGRIYGGIKGRIARFGLAAVDLFVVHSRHEIDSYSAWLGLPKERFRFVPLPLNVRDGTEPEDESQPFVLAMGSAHRDYRCFCEALGRLGYPATIVAAPHALEGVVLPPNVQHLSGLTWEECHRLCQHARVNVVAVDNPDTASGQVSLLEAMMYAKAVVATACVGSVDYLTHGETGLLVPSRDADAMAAAIASLWNDPEQRQRLGRNARRYVEQNLTFEAAARRMEPLLQELESRCAKGKSHPKAAS